ncbi:MAG: type II toxin-antitoxin system HicB family antitoxin [Dehalococcoidia bacterium]
MKFTILFDRKADGRWLADVPERAGATGEGETAWKAAANAQAIVLRAIADELEQLAVSPEHLVIEFEHAESE